MIRKIKHGTTLYSYPTENTNRKRLCHCEFYTNNSFDTQKNKDAGKRCRKFPTLGDKKSIKTHSKKHVV